jgi:hypothetical protein
MSMSVCALSGEREYRSGEVVDPGAYVDLESGSVVHIKEKDELPEGSKVVQYRRRFRRLSTATVWSSKQENS